MKNLSRNHLSGRSCLSNLLRGNGRGPRARRPGNLAPNPANTGFDAVYMGGSSLAGHPMGIRAGVSTFRQATEAFRLGIDVRDYAADHQ